MKTMHRLVVVMRGNAGENISQEIKELVRSKGIRNHFSVSETFFSRTCLILFSNFSRTRTRDALGAVPCYNWQNNHVPMPAWLSDGQRDYFRTPPKSQQLHTDWTAHFSVCCHPPARILGPARTEDCNSWSKMITLKLICAWQLLICVSLNPRCLQVLGGGADP